MPTNPLDLRDLLAAVEGAPPIEAVDVLARELARAVGATGAGLLIANFGGDAVVRMSHVAPSGPQRDGRNERAESLALRGSVYERVLLSQELDVRFVDPGWEVLVPVTERGDAIGLLELSVPEHPDPDVVAYLEAAAHALAYVLIATRRHTDVFEWAQRDLAFTLPAEIQRRLLPASYTIEGGAFTLAGWLEPANEVGGDTFDYSLDREYLYASVTDAMGHATESALLATLTVGSLRNSRRSLAAPSEQAATANAALLATSRPDQFVTGLLLRIRLADGRLELVNAGHPNPYLLRAGEGAVLHVAADPVLGVAEVQYRTHVTELEPGDRLLVVTDGFLERNAVDVDIQRVLETNAERHPREVVHELASELRAATGGSLRDDATVLCIDWYGSAGRRQATSGASRDRATEI